MNRRRALQHLSPDLWALAKHAGAMAFAPASEQQQIARELEAQLARDATADVATGTCPDSKLPKIWRLRPVVIG